jgi:hypothetical protein
VGKRGIKTALRKRIKELGICYGQIATDNRNRFPAVLRENRHLVGKKYTVGTTAD